MTRETNQGQCETRPSFSLIEAAATSPNTAPTGWFFWILVVEGGLDAEVQRLLVTLSKLTTSLDRSSRGKPSGAVLHRLKGPSCRIVALIVKFHRASSMEVEGLVQFEPKLLPRRVRPCGPRVERSCGTGTASRPNGPTAGRGDTGIHRPALRLFNFSGSRATSGHLVNTGSRAASLARLAASPSRCPSGARRYRLTDSGHRLLEIRRATHSLNRSHLVLIVSTVHPAAPGSPHYAAPDGVRSARVTNHRQ